MKSKKYSLIPILIWTAQAIIALSFVWGGLMKLFQPIERLKLMWPWTAAISSLSLTMLGLIDLCGGLAILIPTLLQRKSKLVPVIAVCILVQMIAAGIFHVLRSELAAIGANIFFALLAGFIAWVKRKDLNNLSQEDTHKFSG